MPTFDALAECCRQEPDWRYFVINSIWPLSISREQVRARSLDAQEDDHNGPALTELQVLNTWPLQNLRQHENSTDTQRQLPDLYSEELIHPISECLDQIWQQVKKEDHWISSVQDLLRLIEKLQINEDMNLNDLVREIEQQTLDQSITTPRIIASLELAARMWSMMNIRYVPPLGRQHSQQESLCWRENQTLRAVISQNVTKVTNIDEGHFPKQMNVWDMKKIAGLHVVWTDNLTMHLTMKGQNLYLFPNVSVLRRMEVSQSLLSQEFIAETLATIGLLMPLTHNGCNRWLRAEIQQFEIDCHVVDRELPNIEKSNYVYWHDRLLMIEEFLQTRNPQTISQWWHDTRDMQRWWMFWLAAIGLFLTVLFGFIQSVTGIIQVVRPS